MTQRMRVTIEGIVQGVGFRPFVYRLAAAGRLAGWVRNTPAGVLLEAEGDEQAIATFLRGLREEAPPLAVIDALVSEPLPQTGEQGFAILASGGGERVAEISPDCDVCPDCLRELFDPGDRQPPPCLNVLQGDGSGTDTDMIVDNVTGIFRRVAADAFTFRPSASASSS